MTATEEHPYLTAWRTRDAEAWGRHLSPAVVLDSPLLRAPFTGREVAVELFAALFEAFDDFEVTDAYERQGSAVFFWRTATGGRTVEGVDRLTSGDDGLIDRVTVFVRPLVGLAVFSGGLGPALAARRSRARGLAARAAAPVVRALFAAVDRAGGAIVR